jgi:hypothetical protein
VNVSAIVPPRVRLAQVSGQAKPVAGVQSSGGFALKLPVTLVPSALLVAERTAVHGRSAKDGDAAYLLASLDRLASTRAVI